MVEINIPGLQARIRAKDGATYYVYDPPNDAKYSGACAFETLGEDPAKAIIRAQQLHLQVLHWRRTGEIQKGSSKALTMTELSEKYMGSGFYTSLTPYTQKIYRNLLKASLRKANLGSMIAESLSQEFVDQFYTDWIKDSGLSYANKLRMLWTRVFNIGARWELLRRNPWQHIEGIAEKPRKVVWAGEGLALFIAKAQELGRPSVGLGVLLMFELCQRRDDILHLRWDQLVGDAADIVQRKTKEHVIVALPGYLVQRLKELQKSSKSIYVLVNDHTGKPYAVWPNTFSVHAQAIRKAAGLPDHWQVRDLRRTGTTELSGANVSDDLMASVGGWRSRQMLQRYSVKSGDKARLAQEKRWAARGKSPHE